MPTVMKTNVNPANAKPSTYQSGVVNAVPLRAGFRAFALQPEARAIGELGARPDSTAASVPVPRVPGEPAHTEYGHDAIVDHQVQTFLGLGANVGDAVSTLSHAVTALGALPGATLRAVSPLYRTSPVGPLEQPDFVNAVAALDVPAGADPESGAMALLVALKALERSLGRQERQRWGPRELDIDLLLFGDHHLHVERSAAARSLDADRTGVEWLDVPHVAARERLFVLAPLADLAPQLRPPGWGVTVAEAQAAAIAAEGPDAVRKIAAWDDDRGRWPGDAAAGQQD